MREALLIFRKDVHHLWPRAIPVLAATALLGWMERQPLLLPILETLEGIWLLSAAYLAVSVIHQEALPGNQQYWLTRPFHWSHLALAKGLFLAVFAGLPLLAIETLSLSANGVSPWRHVFLLLSASAIFAGGACSVAAALASVTENLVQFLLAFLPSAGVVILGVVLANTNDHSGDWQWDSLEWIRTSALGAWLLATAIAVILLQYSRRQTAVSRALMGVAVLIAGAGPFLGSWHGAWAIESKFSRLKVDDSTARIAFDPVSRPALGFGDAAYSPALGQAGINLPVVVLGIPAGTEVVSERTATRIDGEGGRSWSSSWTRMGGLYRTGSFDDALVIPRDGSYWEYVNVDEAFYRTVKDSPVHVHLTLALTLLGERKTAPLATRDRNEYHSDDGMCRVTPGPFAKLMVSCAWLVRTPARGYVTAVSIRNGQTYSSLITAGSGSPYPMKGSLWEVGSALFAPPPATHEMDLETWQAVAHFDREFDLPQIRLADYAVRRITDMP